MMKTLLIGIVEDDLTLREVLQAGLKYEGYQIALASDGREGLEMIKNNEIDLLILDIKLPDMDGFELCRRIRDKGFEMPILMLTAKKEVEDRVKGLDVGADDYLTKPFDFDELLVRIRALLRRYRKTSTEVLTGGGVCLNPETKEVYLEGKPLKLTPTEFKLLELLMRHPRRVFSKQTLLHRIWGYEYADPNLVDVHISRLRKKLGDRPVVSYGLITGWVMPFIRKVESVPLKWRLSFLFSGVLAVILASVGISLFYFLSHFLIEDAATDIRAVAKPVIEHWLYSSRAMPPLVGFGPYHGTPDEEHLRKIAFPLARDLTSRDITALVFDAKGDLLASGKVLPEEPQLPPVPKRLIARALSGEKEVNYIARSEGERLLMVFIPLRESPQSSHILGAALMGMRLKDIDDTLRRWGFLMIGALDSALAVGVVLSLVVVSWVLKPLGTMVQTCQVLASGRLNQRLPFVHRSDEIGRLAAAFNDMVDQLQHIFESQKRFLAQAAHELRTPLAGIRGSIDVLLRGVMDNPHDAAPILKVMRREVGRLSRLCEEILDLVHLEVSSRVEKSKVSLRQLVEEMAFQAQHLAPDGPVVLLTPGPEIKLLLDVDKFKQALLNLLENALRHTPKDRKVTVTWMLLEGWVKISICDEGPGIAPSEIPHIFKPFYQGQGKVGKLGLGLPLAKTIVEAHGGKIDVKSAMGRGSVFEIYLPLDPPL